MDKLRCAQIEHYLREYTVNKGLLLEWTGELTAKQKRAELSVRAIDDLLAIADEEDKHLLKARYFALHPQSVRQIADSLYTSRMSFYRRRDILLSWLEGRLAPLFDEE